METTIDYEIVDTMEAYGGGFVKALALAMRKADNFNFDRLVAAFPEYWDQYREMAKLIKEKQPAADGGGEGG